MKLFLKEIKDRYIRENFKRLQTTVIPLGKAASGSSGNTTITNVTNIVGGAADEAPKTIITKVCTELISQFKIVRLVSSTDIAIASIETYAKAKAVGISLESGNVGESVRVLTFGILDDPSFSLLLNEPIFLATAGGITLFPPISAGLFELTIGQSLGTGSIQIKVGEPKEIL